MVWILPYDPFGKDYMLYSVKNVVEEKYMNLQEAMERYAREWAQEMAEEMEREKEEAMAREMAQEKENNRWMIINDLLEKGKIDDLKRAAADLEYRAKIFEECKR